MRTVYRDWAFWMFLFIGISTLFFIAVVAGQTTRLVAAVDRLRQQMAVVNDQNARSIRERDDLYVAQGEVKSSLKRLEDFVDAIKDRATKAEAARKKAEAKK